VLTLKIYFAMDSSFVDAKATRSITTFMKRVNDKLVDGDVITVSIAGFVQPTLVNPAPMELSLARTRATAKALKSKGLAGNYLLSVGGIVKVNAPSSRYAFITVVISHTE